VLVPSLPALSEFFDEVEDLKFNYAQAQAELERLEEARRG
jgi:ubiquinone biosynthesis protein UbiJ